MIAHTREAASFSSSSSLSLRLILPVQNLGRTHSCCLENSNDSSPRYTRADSLRNSPPLQLAGPSSFNAKVKRRRRRRSWREESSLSLLLLLPFGGLARKRDPFFAARHENYRRCSRRRRPGHRNTLHYKPIKSSCPSLPTTIEEEGPTEFTIFFSFWSGTVPNRGIFLIEFFLYFVRYWGNNSKPSMFCAH